MRFCYNKSFSYLRETSYYNIEGYNNIKKDLKALEFIIKK